MIYEPVEKIRLALEECFRFWECQVERREMSITLRSGAVVKITCDPPERKEGAEKWLRM
jgi:hypothetical protein